MIVNSKPTYPSKNHASIRSMEAEKDPFLQQGQAVCLSKAGDGFGNDVHNEALAIRDIPHPHVVKMDVDLETPVKADSRMICDP